MSRTARASKGGVCYHVINRGNGRATVYHDANDYQYFAYLMRYSCSKLPMRILAWCLMPNHFHLVLWPHEDGDLGRWMHRLLTGHVKNYHKKWGTSGRIWQGRFKAFPIEQDLHLLTVLRYVERNPLRANLVKHAQEWLWSSVSVSPCRPTEGLVVDSPVPKPSDWRKLVDQPHNKVELEALRQCSHRGTPFGSDRWAIATAAELGLESTLRRPGRPRQ